jgi:hypothetical protein
MQRMTCRLLAGFALSIFMSVLACAQQTASKDALLDHLAGNWVLEGNIAGEEATYDVASEWVMDRHYLRVHAISRETQPNGQPAYEANFFIDWDKAADQYNCVWLDNTGRISQDSFASAKRSGDRITFAFKDKEGLSLLTFKYDAQSDSWEWRLQSGQNDVEPFALVKLSKVN